MGLPQLDRDQTVSMGWRDCGHGVCAVEGGVRAFYGGKRGRKGFREYRGSDAREGNS